MAAAAANSSPTLLYIAGSGRSGSTLLDNILGQVEGVCAVGELRMLWQAGLVRGRLCGCGERVRDCSFWREAQVRAFGRAAPNSESVAELGRAHLRIRPRQLLRLRRAASRRRPAPELERYLSVLVSLYRAIAEMSAVSVVVDSSKTPTQAYALDTLTDLDVRIVHLVRDPRGYAYSRSQQQLRRDSPGRERRKVVGAVNSSTRWLADQLLVDQLVRPVMGDRYMVLRYEDFVAKPVATVRSVCDFVGLVDATLPFSGDREVELLPTHGASGDPNRVGREGPVHINPDTRWKASMTRRDRWLVSLIAAPLLHRYGYSLNSPRLGQRAPGPC
jgi:hypothetical protein